MTGGRKETHMESRRRAYGARLDGDSEQQGQQFMQVILQHVILRKTDEARRRTILAFSTSAMAALLRQPPDRSAVCLSELRDLMPGQLDGLLAGLRYVWAVERARMAARGLRRAAIVAARGRLASCRRQPRARESRPSWH
jgi:hypothetical protein